MKKTLIASALGLACAMSFPTAEAACNWTGQRIGLLGSGAVVGTLVAGPVGTVVGAALGDWLSGSSDTCHTEKVATAPAPAPAPPAANPYANLMPFNDKGETSVYFPTGSNTLTKVDEAMLNKAAVILKSHHNFNLAIVGAADPRGKNGYNNMALSLRRANVVKNYLVQHEGIDAKRVFTKGVGAVQIPGSERYNKLRVAKLKLVDKQSPEQKM